MANLEEEHTALHIAVMNRVIDRARRQALFPCGDFPGLEKDKFIRIAVRKPDENEILIQALNEGFRAG